MEISRCSAVPSITLTGSSLAGYLLGLFSSPSADAVRVIICKRLSEALDFARDSF